EIFRERAIAVMAEMSHVRAEVAEAARTVSADSARHDRMCRDPRARSEVVYLCAARDNDPGRFVAENAGKCNGKRIAREIVQVRRANRGCQCADEHVPRPRRGYGQR